jgi:acetyl-CoA carboxylase beta subunit
MSLAVIVAKRMTSVFMKNIEKNTPLTTLEGIGGDTMNEKKMELIQEVCQILEKRATDSERSHEMRIAYNSALIMLMYALNEDAPAVAQFNY